MSLRITSASDAVYSLATPNQRSFTTMGRYYMESILSATHRIVWVIYQQDNSHYLALLIDQGPTGGALRIQADSPAVDGARVITPGDWRDLAITYDGTTLRGYLDGTLEASLSANDTFTPFAMLLGANGDTYTDCRLADWRVWSGRVLTQAQIQAEIASRNVVASATNLWGHWLLSSDLLDGSGNGHDLTSYTGTPTWADDPEVSGVTGYLSQTLGGLTGSAAGTLGDLPTINGALAKTLGALTGSAAGTLGSLPGLSGSLAQTLGALTATATGTVQVSGAVAATLGALTASAAGSLRVNGVVATTLGALTAEAVGSVMLRGTVNVTLGPLMISEAGVVPVTGGGMAAAVMAGYMGLLPRPASSLSGMLGSERPAAAEGGYTA